MNVEIVVQTIQLAIAPTVMITSCMLIQSAILGRYASIGNQLRTLARNRGELLTEEYPEVIFNGALPIVDREINLLTRRHLLIKNTVIILYGAIICFLLSMLAIGAAKGLNFTLLASIALTLFLIGTVTLLAGVMVASSEIRISHQAVHLEVRWAMTLTKLENYRSSDLKTRRNLAHNTLE